MNAPSKKMYGGYVLPSIVVILVIVAVIGVRHHWPYWLNAVPAGFALGTYVVWMWRRNEEQDAADAEARNLQ